MPLKRNRTHNLKKDRSCSTISGALFLQATVESRTGHELKHNLCCYWLNFSVHVPHPVPPGIFPKRLSCVHPGLSHARALVLVLELIQGVILCFTHWRLKKSIKEGKRKLTWDGVVMPSCFLISGTATFQGRAENNVASIASASDFPFFGLPPTLVPWVHLFFKGIYKKWGISSWELCFPVATPAFILHTSEWPWCLWKHFRELDGMLQCRSERRDRRKQWTFVPNGKSLFLCLIGDSTPAVS